MIGVDLELVFESDFMVLRGSDNWVERRAAVPRRAQLRRGMPFRGVPLLR